MMLKIGLLALIATTAMTSAATADCRVMGYVFHVAQNDSVSTTGVSTGGSRCTTRIRSFSTTQFTSGSIASPPGNGSLSQAGMLEFTYKPKAGFKGVDRYSIRICGKATAGAGCSTVTFNITVE